MSKALIRLADFFAYLSFLSRLLAMGTAEKVEEKEITPIPDTGTAETLH